MIGRSLMWRSSSVLRTTFEQVARGINFDRSWSLLRSVSDLDLKHVLFTRGPNMTVKDLVGVLI